MTSSEFHRAGYFSVTRALTHTTVHHLNPASGMCLNLFSMDFAKKAGIDSLRLTLNSLYSNNRGTSWHSQLPIKLTGESIYTKLHIPALTTHLKSGGIRRLLLSSEALTLPSSLAHICMLTDQYLTPATLFRAPSYSLSIGFERIVKDGLMGSLW